MLIVIVTNTSECLPCARHWFTFINFLNVTKSQLSKYYYPPFQVV